MEGITPYDKLSYAALLLQGAALAKVWLETRRQRTQIDELNGVINQLTAIIGRLYGFRDAVKRCHIRACPFKDEADGMTTPMPDIELLLKRATNAGD